MPSIDRRAADLSGVATAQRKTDGRSATTPPPCLLQPDNQLPVLTVVDEPSHPFHGRWRTLQTLETRRSSSLSTPRPDQESYQMIKWRRGHLGSCPRHCNETTALGWPRQLARHRVPGHQVESLKTLHFRDSYGRFPGLPRSRCCPGTGPVGSEAGAFIPGCGFVGSGRYHRQQ